MIGSLVKNVFGSRNERLVRKLRKKVARINELEEAYGQLSDAELQAKTPEFKARLEQGEKLEDLIPEAFATVREVSQRTFNMRPFDVQLIGGMILNDNKIAEMRTGEGKTLTATLPCYLNALTGKGVHVITVNDYLAQRDADWSRPFYEFLGMTVGCNVAGMTPTQKQEAYACDVLYGTNNEFGFDYLRDNMAFTPGDRVQRDLYFAIVDEVDSILIDEARTPLVISGPAEDSSEMYEKINTLVPQLTRQQEETSDGEEDTGDFTIDEKAKQLHLTEAGQRHIEDILQQEGLLDENETLYSAGNISLLHHVNAALRAHHLFQRDVDYIVKDGQVIIVDEHTGRTMEGRRWSEGLHQAVEAKEGVPVQNENQTLASITFQNYFRLYEKLAGMTGTADTEAFEFQSIYGLETVVVPTNKPMVRVDEPDLIYMTAAEKYQAIVADIREQRDAGRPILVGTSSIESSELVSRLLRKEKIKHQVLNAKFHAQEAEIIARAGEAGAVTIATNMAGRGTDIVLGGNLLAELAKLPEDTSDDKIEQVKAAWQERHDAVVEAGGLHIIGTERHESRRIDNQLRGRAGRQGDPGSSRFYLSLEDSLMRIFASDRMAGMMKKLGMKEGEAIEHPWVTKAIENAQRKVESRNFDIRKQLLEYDDVANDQRRVVYEQRNSLLDGADISETIETIREDVLNQVIDEYIPPQSLEEMWNVAGLEKRLKADFDLDLPIQRWLDEDDKLFEEILREKIVEEATKAYREKEEQVGEKVIRNFEKAVMLQSLDQHWKEHLAAMDQLRQGIHLRGYANKNPKQEYKREAYDLFMSMLETMKLDTVSILSKVKVRAEEDVEAVERERQKRSAAPREYRHDQSPTADAQESGSQSAAGQSAAGQGQRSGGPQGTVKRQGEKVGRNDPCPCGSGKKYKHCCGKLT